MKQVNGQNNEMTIIFPNERIDCFSSQNEKFNKIIHQANITITGNNNHISLCFDSEESAEELLVSDGFLLIVKGDNNIINLGTIILRYSTILGMTGLKLIVGQLPGLGPGVSRVANNCRVDIGNRVVINGITLYLQEDNSHVSIGDDSQLSWGIDIWCTDAHTITNLKGEPINFAQSIEIGKHVWIGKDVKIGKNVRIPDNSIVGWGSIVTKKFDEPNVIIAGTPAKIVKRGINWDRKCINKYLNK
ncbi:acyltransferase [Parabacteroides pacaensis]|uniref:acyltransferase n=1 Tax=Parabacteroides pacaensis TaxID=2086575 RepID=UPI000D100C42|nr:acyltransferase [Parabacteroides pacaensis]